MNILIIIWFFFLFVQKHFLIPHSYTLWTNILFFSCWDVENKQRKIWQKKQKSVKKEKQLCTFNVCAWKSSKVHLHMQKINRFWKDNQSIECYTYFCNQRSIFLVSFCFPNRPKEAVSTRCEAHGSWAGGVGGGGGGGRRVRRGEVPSWNDRCCPCPLGSSAPLMGALWLCIPLLLLRGNSHGFMASLARPPIWWLAHWLPQSSMWLVPLSPRRTPNPPNKKTDRKSKKRSNDLWRRDLNVGPFARGVVLPWGEAAKALETSLTVCGKRYLLTRLKVCFTLSSFFLCLAAGCDFCVTDTTQCT